MSVASRQARAERRAAGAEPVEALIRAAALIADGGGYRVAVLAMPQTEIERWAVSVSESEVLALQLPIAAAELERAARGELDADGRPAHARCLACGLSTVVRHPTKPVRLCAACGHREDAR